jgi:hypothetical protein
MRLSPFPNSIQSNPDSLEFRIASELWRWAFLKDDARSELQSPRGDLALNIEFYLCGVFRIVPVAQSNGWWCDGVMELSITKISRTSFRIAGAAYFGNSAPCYLAPFELEFHFAKRRNPEPARVIVRFGELGPNGSIRLCKYPRNAALIATNRPRQERDWVIAVELTPNG